MVLGRAPCARPNTSFSSISHSLEQQDPVKLEFVYQGSDLISATLAAQEFASLLSTETGLTIEVSLQPCDLVVVGHLDTGEADVAPINAYAYVMGREMSSMEARLVNGLFGSFSISGQFNIQAASGYTSLLDLQGMRYVAPDETSLSGYLAPYVHILETTGMRPEDFFGEVAFAGGHSNVIREVYTGTANVGSTFVDARGSVAGEFPDVFDVVSVLTYTDPIPNQPWVFRSALDSGTVQTLADGIQAVAGTSNGEAALETIFDYDLTGIDVVQDSDYDIYRSILDVFGEGWPGGCHQIYVPITTKDLGPG